ncbi:MAG TPA: serine/threonine-protein kinase [Kofleriaceae bacterium]|jgi:serine/threonine-protein kinase|nr:serine/threonine-protein kinase [Kofleriaceae bacterium]
MESGSMIGGRYQLVDVVAEGGLSTVWQGVARASEVFARPVAIKVMKRAFSTVGGPYLSMFLEEARIGARLQHANVIQVLDFIVEATPTGPTYCLVMEWVDGIDLRTLMRVENALGRKLPWGLVATVGLRVLRGLAAAHERRLPDNTLSPVIHRDVSPQNILLALNGDIKLADFGMARARDRIAEHTAPGFVKGTLSYMAPEILVGKPASPASDLFSLAITLWESLAGERLFHAKSDIDVIEAIRRCAVPPLADRRPDDVPPALAAVIHRALSKEPEARFVSARQMAHELNEILRGEDSWGDADVLVGNAVAEARVGMAQLPPAPPAPGSSSGSR